MSDIDKLNRMQLDLLERDRKIRALEEQIDELLKRTCPHCGQAL